MSIGNYNFLTNLYANSAESGIVTFKLPNANGDGTFNIVQGFLTGDITTKLGNKWQAILPNIDSITLASQIINGAQGSNNALAWIASTQSAWMGAEPLRISIPFYLFSFDDTSKIQDKINYFRALQSPYKVNNSNFEVILHGGYNPQVFEGDWNGASNANNNNLLVNNLVTANDIKGGGSKGLIQIQIGNQIFLTDMLLEDAPVEQSQILVRDGNPLYAKITATFKSRRVMYADEIKNMFTAKSIPNDLPSINNNITYI